MLRRTIASLSLALCLTLLGVGLTGCDSTDTASEDAPPVIEPAAFAIDTESFGGVSTTSAPATTAPAKAGSNFIRASASVGIVSTIVGVNLLIPNAVTAAALSADPFVDEGTWVWESTTSFTGADGVEKTATFRLEGTPDGEFIDWEMIVSGVDSPNGGTLDGFVLYTAQTALDGSEGSWNLFYLIDGTRTNVLDARFDVDGESTKDLLFEVPDGVGEAGGDDVSYSLQGEQRAFEYTKASPAERIVVNWDAETKAGSVTATGYNNGERACWGPAPDLNNVPCN